MGFNLAAINKGMTSEYLAKAYYSSRGYAIIQPDSHESHYDFLITTGGANFERVQVKTITYMFNKQSPKGIARVRNKRGQNGVYPDDAYDYLAAVDPYRNEIVIFKAKDVLGNNRTETISLYRPDGSRLSKPSKQYVDRAIYRGPVIEVQPISNKEEWRLRN